ncbi:MAG: hypothetical protein A4E38_00031 [Methanoregulaceae archaeon PtaB.Bin108]|nr:MAG: hypothetical protein A4E38_00031 [Methanoregulaceae archaeon PtaB.Bin108]
MNHFTHARLCLVTLTLIIVTVALTIPTAALKVEGARIALDVEPGKTYTSPIGVSIKPEESGGDFSIDVLGFGQALEGGIYTALDASMDISQYSARSYITIDTPIIHLEPGDRADVTATISIPSGTRDGGRYAIILVHPAASTSEAPAAFATAVAIPVFLTVKAGTISEIGEITALEPSITESALPFEILTTFRNSGNYHYYSVVNVITVTNSQEKIVATAKSDPFIRAIVPGQSVKFTGTIQTGLSQGNYQVTSRIEMQDGGLLAEKKVTLQVGNPAPVQVTTQMTHGQTGLFIPGFGSVMAILGLAGALLGIFWFRRGGKG